jgi:hypothetical protein
VKTETGREGEWFHTPMTLRFEIYFPMLKSSSKLGRGVTASASGMRMSLPRLKDPKRSEYQRVKENNAVRGGSRLKRETDSDWFFGSCSSMVVRGTVKI